VARRARGGYRLMKGGQVMAQSALWAFIGLFASLFNLSLLVYADRVLDEENARVEEAQRRRETGSGL
jgi:hypothetical protein